MRRPRRARLIDPSVAHLDGAGLAGLLPYAQKAALTAAIGTAGPLIDRLSHLPDVPKEDRDAYVYIKSVLEQSLSPRNLLYAPAAAAAKMFAGDAAVKAIGGAGKVITAVGKALNPFGLSTLLASAI